MSGFADHLRGCHVLVVGCGATGVSAARFAARCGARVRVVDSRPDAPGAAGLATSNPDIQLSLGALDMAALDGIDEIVISPGVDLREPLIVEAARRGHALVGDIEWFARMAAAPVVAITGSNGKSTVTAWVGELARAAGLKTAIGGNYGTPALDLLADDVELYVVELSSFQLELTHALAARAAVVLNISADHIDRHGSIEHYAALKARIFEHAEIAVINADDERVVAMDTHSAKVVQFGTSPAADYRLLEDSLDRGGSCQLAHGQDPVIAADALGLAGRHNAANALAVWALADAIGVPGEIIQQGLRSFEGLPHRCQLVAERAGVRWVNDSKGTNLGALLASLAGMNAPVVLLAGGLAKSADFAALAPVAAAKARAVIVFGRDGHLIAEAVSDQVDVHTVADLAAAVPLAAALAQPGDTVLLSPGCASFDQFTGYAQRGDCFAAAVRELAA